jgi:chitin disaccharide deacetylase
MSDNRYLIVNADDFGQSPGVNSGVIQAHGGGIVTSTSLMVRWPAAAEAAEYGCEHPELSLGLHLDLCEWAFRNGSWKALYEVVPPADSMAVKQECLRQLAAFQAMTGRPPSHIDSHQHMHLREPAHTVAAEMAASLSISLRGCDLGVKYCGQFYGQTGEGEPLPDQISVEALIRILHELPAGITELGCHPAIGNDLDTMYGEERERELKVLCDPRVRAAIAANGIRLCSFAEIPVLTRDGTA